MTSVPRLSVRFLMAGFVLASALATISPLIAGSNAGAAFSPDDPWFGYSSDATMKGFPGQWHLVNQAPSVIGSMKNAGYDSNIRGAWQNGWTGKGVVIGIIDDGVEVAHPDLAPNYRADLSKNFSQGSAAGLPQNVLAADDAHGTAVAGVAAARGGNGIGTTGAAPLAQIAGQRIQFGAGSVASPGVTDQDFVDAYLWKSGVTAAGLYAGEAEIHVKNNSYGMGAPFTSNDAEAIKAGVYASRNNQIYLFAAANSRGSINQQSAGLALNSADFSINVVAFGSDGVFSDYSNWGAAAFIAAPSNRLAGGFGIMTTDRTGGYGYNATGTTAVPGSPADGGDDKFPDAAYTESFGGTSSATPLVSGIVALGKQAAPAMDVRMAKHALASTARLVDSTDNNSASAGRWVTNGGGYHFNPDYGFGLVDATAFVNRVVDIAYVTDRTANTASGTVGALLGSTGLTKTISVAAAAGQQKLESVEVKLSLNGTSYYKDFQLSLQSPFGTSSDLYRYNDTPDAPMMGSFYTDPLTNWTFLSNAFWGESIVGDWKLTASNRSSDLTWVNYAITFNMGEFVLESGAMALSHDVKAHSINLDHGDSLLTIPAGRVFTVTDSVNLYGGTIVVDGTLTEGNPDLAANFNKLSKVTVTTGAALRVGATGKVQATRGIDVAGGQLVLATGATLASTTGVTVREGGVVNAAGDFSIAGSSLGVESGARVTVARDLAFATVTLRDDGSVLTVNRDVRATTSLIVSGGDLYVAGNIITPRFVVRGGSFSPAGRGLIGDTNITGGFTLEGDGTLVVDVVDANRHDRVVVSSQASLAAGELRVNLLGGGVIHVDDEVDFIVGSAFGRLDSVTTVGGNPFIAFRQHAAESGKLVAAVDFSQVVTRINASPNIKSAAGSLNAVVEAGGSNRAALVAMAESVTTNAEAVRALAAFVPDNGLLLASSAKGQATTLAAGYTSHVSRLRTGDFNGSDFWSNPLFESYSFSYAGRPKFVASTGSLPLFDDNAATNFHVWINGTAGERGSNEDFRANRVKSDERYLNATLGADYRLTARQDEDVHAGVFVGVQSSDTESGQGAGTTDTAAVAPGVYFSAEVGEVEVDLMAAYAMSDYKLKRSIPIAGSTPATADTTGAQWVFRGGASHAFRFKNTLFVSPSASLTYVNGAIDGYREQGGGLAGLAVGKQSYESLESNLGVSVGRRLSVSEVSVFPVVSVGWGHEFLDSAGSTVVSSTALGQAFRYTAYAPEVGADFMTAGASVAVYTSENSRLTLAYNGRFFREGVEADHSVSATLRFDF